MSKKMFACFVAIVCLIGIACIVIVAFLFSAAAAHAASNETKDMLYGALLGSFVHEAAHKFVADRGEMSFSGPIGNPKWEYRGDPGSYRVVTKNGQLMREYYDFGSYKRDLEIVAKGGMVGEGLISHWLMNKNFGNKRLRNMRKGFVLRNILNNAYYLSRSANRGDLDPENFRSEKHRKTFKKIIAIDTAVMAFEYMTKRSLLPKGTSISFKKHTILLTKSWSF